MNQTTELPLGITDITTLTDRVANTALVECVCVDHYDMPYMTTYCKTVNIHGPGHDHACHLCNGYFVLKANTPQDKQKCDNCHGPVRWSGEASCFPDRLMVNNFIDPADQRPTWVQREEARNGESTKID